MGSENLQSRFVLLGIETFLSLVHAPVGPRLRGVGMFGEPDTDRPAAAKAGMFSIARRELGDEADDMSEGELVSAGAAAMGKYLRAS